MLEKWQKRITQQEVSAMLEKPVYGWSNFQLEGTSQYGLSYLDDIAFIWVEQAIHGLEEMLPFCVKGFMEPNRFLCVVSYWNCHIICEDDSRDPLNEENIINEVSHTSMLQFCQHLYNDIHQSIDEWASFIDCDEAQMDITKRKEDLSKKLSYLKDLISKSEERFGKNRCFL